MIYFLAIILFWISWAISGYFSCTAAFVSATLAHHMKVITNINKAMSTALKRYFLWFIPVGHSKLL